MKEKGISSYKLEKQYGMSKSMIFKLKHDKNVNLATVNELCKMFECNLTDVVAYIPDEEAEKKQKKYQSRVINIFSIFFEIFVVICCI